MRINQFIASSTGLSRRAADTAIATGRVQVDDQPAVLGQILPSAARVTLDGQPLALPQTYTYLMLNKPIGYVSSRASQGERPMLYTLLPPQYHTLRIVGRLDQDSSGLVLLTDDGAFTHTHTHPSFGKTKIYELTLARPLKPADSQKLSMGVMLNDGPSHVTVLAHNGRQVRVSVNEGRNRQLRRTFGALGYTVEKLHRTQMGDYSLGDLPEGQWRIIQPAAVGGKS